MDTIYVYVVLGAVVAGFVQGLSGFGFGLVSMALWAWVLDPRLAAVLAVFGGMTGQIVGALSLRRGFDWRLLVPYVLGGVAGIPLGVMLLPMLDVNMFKAALGCLLIVWCPVMIFARRLPKITFGGNIANTVVGLGGGIMGGLGGFSGVLPTLWCTLRYSNRDTQRAIIQNFNLSMLSLTMLSYILSGMVTRPMVPMFLLVVPAILIPSFIGTRVYAGFSPERFRLVVLMLLTVSGLALLASAVPHLVAA
ncbi:MAG: sulfite exporter TauE/SafE family protein [Advenella sp.]|uniref:Probable membrane transporter protein n=1 Tax=Advenella kashmirensis TaxID=310575 RepID=A0A356LEC2_9BURK|nr:sulfite exporter TauE/SafE family protein [Advenella sp. FME57]HBP29159.1 permease [Advenella kashmirensis]